eukprot:5656928-Prymnesium_polylepis.1
MRGTGASCDGFLVVVAEVSAAFSPGLGGAAGAGVLPFSPGFSLSGAATLTMNEAPGCVPAGGLCPAPHRAGCKRPPRSRRPAKHR